MPNRPPGSLEEKAKVAKIVVDRLIELADGFESHEWLEKFLRVQKALGDRRFKDAVREEAKLTCYTIEPRWSVSREMERTLERVMGVLARQVHYPDHVEPVPTVNDLPTDITGSRTIADENARLLKRLASGFGRDPLENDPAFAEILQEASAKADAALADHPMAGGLGFCHVHWEKKKEILQTEYGLNWHTPSEMNPGMIFD